MWTTTSARLGVEVKMHQSHAEGAHHQAFAAGTGANDAVGVRDRVDQTLTHLRCQRREDIIDLVKGALGSELQVDDRYLLNGLVVPPRSTIARATAPRMRGHRGAACERGSGLDASLLT